MSQSDREVGCLPFNSPLAEGCREAAGCSAVLQGLFQTASVKVRFCIAHLFAPSPFGRGSVILPFVFFSHITVIPAAAGIIITRSTIRERRGGRLSFNSIEEVNTNKIQYPYITTFQHGLREFYTM